MGETRVVHASLGSGAGWLAEGREEQRRGITCQKIGQGELREEAEEGLGPVEGRWNRS